MDFQGAPLEISRAFTYALLHLDDRASLSQSVSQSSMDVELILGTGLRFLWIRFFRCLGGSLFLAATFGWSTQFVLSTDDHSLIGFFFCSKIDRSPSGILRCGRD